uniref:Uncharacterized protein n=1 Tax=Megaselia scalaris TaxID=36166 RepID=T1GJA9_MEGSC
MERKKFPYMLVCVCDSNLYSLCTQYLSNKLSASRGDSFSDLPKKLKWENQSWWNREIVVNVRNSQLPQTMNIYWKHTKV